MEMKGQREALLELSSHIYKPAEPAAVKLARGASEMHLEKWQWSNVLACREERYGVGVKQRDAYELDIMYALPALVKAGRRRETPLAVSAPASGRRCPGRAA